MIYKDSFHVGLTEPFLTFSLHQILMSVHRVYTIVIRMQDVLTMLVDSHARVNQALEDQDCPVRVRVGFCSSCHAYLPLNQDFITEIRNFIGRFNYFLAILIPIKFLALALNRPR